MAQQMILILFLFLLPAAITAYQPESPLPPSDPCYEPPPPPSPSPPPPPSPSPPPPPSPSPPPPPSPSPPPPPSPSPPPPPSPSPPPPPSPSPPPPPPKCYPYGSITCKRIVYPTYTCSPPVTAYTQGVLRVYDFSILGDGYGPAKCDRKYHNNNNERVVALSTGWYDGGRRCGNTIYIQANGKSTTAKVVDECDSTRGCDLLHRRPCGYNVVGGSKAVWKALKIDENEEEVKILWSTW